MRRSKTFSRVQFLTLLAVVLLAVPGTLGAQEPPPAAPPPAAPPPAAPPPAAPPPVAPPPVAPPAVTPRVADAWNSDQGKNTPGNRELDVDDVLVVEVAGLGAWLDQEQKSACDVRLYLDGRKLEELEPVSCTASGDELSFDLWQIDRGKEEAWKKLLLAREGLKAEKTPVSVGLGDEKPLPTDVDDMTFVVVFATLSWMALVGFAVVLGLFLWLAAVSNMIRDPVPGAARSPYSLARSQMAWWFFLVLGGYLFLTLLTGALPEIPGTILGLMGISAGTFLGAEVVGAGKQNAAGSPPPPADGPEADKPPAEESETDKPETAPKTAEPTVPQDSLRQYFVDILMGPDGLAFHRFQIAVWTLALGIIYLVKVWGDLAMPDFDANLLGLMGISAGTYVGFKFPEKNKSGS